jgi:hypothetical protein
MIKKFLSILISVILLCLTFSILGYATEETTPQPSSSVTITVNMSEKMKSYYSKIYVSVGQLANDNTVIKTYNFWAYDYRDFVISTTLPNGNYVLLTACIPNDFEQIPAKTQYFTVGNTAHTLIETEVIKDMSAYPDRTTAPSIFEDVSNEDITSEIVDVPTPTTEEQTLTSRTEETSAPIAIQPEKNESPWVSIIFSVLFIVAIGIVVFVVFKKIQKYRNDY